MVKSLYICYFGVREPLVQTQVIPYLRELVKGGHELTLLTFEPGEVDEGAVRESLKADGIEWHWLKYHKRPSVPATMFDIANGARYIRKLAAEKNFDILHCRSHVPTMMAAVARKGMRRKPRLLFDIRGFLFDEYADAGVWARDGLLYKSAKSIERWLLKESDGFVVLTEAARNELFPESATTFRDKFDRPVEVIPCCVDFESRFSETSRYSKVDLKRALEIEDRRVITHLGALGGLYLTKELADLIACARSIDPRVFAIFLTQSSPEMIAPLLKERGLNDEDYLIRRVGAHEVPRYLLASDIGLSFVTASYATMSRSPTKIPEYLASGLPVIANTGVGDTDKQLTEDRTGVLVDKFEGSTLARAVAETLELLEDDDLAERCRRSSRARFDLGKVGGERYRRLYGNIADSKIASS